MPEFLLGVLASLAAAVVLAIVAILWRNGRQGLSHFVRGRRAALRLLSDGLSNYFETRGDYARHGSPRLLDYLGLAEESIDIVSYWMAQGVEMENLARGLETMLREKSGLRVRISVIDPDSALVGLVAKQLSLSEDHAAQRVRVSIDELSSLRERLDVNERHRFQLLLSSSLPTGSIIMLDAHRPNGRVQLNIKWYRQPLESSTTLELQGPDAALYRKVRDAALQQLGDATPYDQRRP